MGIRSVLRVRRYARLQQSSFHRLALRYFLGCACCVLAPAHATIVTTGDIVLNVGGPLWIGNSMAGSLTVNGGSALTPATPGFAGYNAIALGQESTGTGTVLVNGAGSAVTAGGAFIVGVRGTGTAQIDAGGQVATQSLTIGSLNGGIGQVTVSGTGSALNVVTSGPSVFGGRAEINVGREQTGRLDILAGGKVTLDPAPTGTALTAFGIGGGVGTLSPGGSFTNGVGTVVIDGAGSELRIKQNFVRTFVGRQGTAFLTISNGGKLIAETGEQGMATSIVGLNATGKGTVNVTGAGSEWQAGVQLFIGSSAGGQGLVSVTDGGTVRVTESITTRPTGTLTGGGGSLIGNVINEGTIAPGSSPGVMNVFGNVNLTAQGNVEIELGGSSPGQYDQLNAYDNPATQIVEGNLIVGGTVEVSLFGGFAPLAGSFFDVFTAVDIAELVPVFAFPDIGSGLTWERSIVTTLDGREALRLAVVGQVPEPGMLALLALALGALALSRARRFGVRPLRA